MTFHSPPGGDVPGFGCITRPSAVLRFCLSDMVGARPTARVILVSFMVAHIAAADKWAMTPRTIPTATATALQAGQRGPVQAVQGIQEARRTTRRCHPPFNPMVSPRSIMGRRESADRTIKAKNADDRAANAATLYP